MGQVQRHRAKVKQLLDAGPVPSSDYEPVLAELAAKGKSPNVGLFLAVLKDHREAGAVGFPGGIQPPQPAAVPASQRRFSEDP